MSNAQNGARIKAWAGAGVGSGIVKNVTFDLFFETDVDNPTIIDQVRTSFPLLCRQCVLNANCEFFEVLHDLCRRMRIKLSKSDPARKIGVCPPSPSPILRRRACTKQ